MFNPEERQIFLYHDGTRERRGDPVLIQGNLRKALGDCNIEAKFKEIDTGDPLLALPAMEQLAEATRVGFDVKPLDDSGEGLTLRETVDLLADYFEWLGKQKKSGVSSPNSSPPTDSPLDSTDSVTTNTSDSGAIAPE